MVASSQQTTKRRGTGRPWKKGQSGNPAGRPKNGLNIVDSLQKALERVVDEETGKTRGELLAETYISLGEQGSVAAIENIIARFHGKPEQGIKVSGDEERPLHVRHSERGKS